MKKNKNDQHNQQSDNKSYQKSAGNNAENAQTTPDNQLQLKPEKNIPVKQDLDNRRSIKNRPHLH